jgi:hypothetical protein
MGWLLSNTGYVMAVLDQWSVVHLCVKDVLSRSSFFFKGRSICVISSRMDEENYGIRYGEHVGVSHVGGLLGITIFTSKCW